MKKYLFILLSLIFIGTTFAQNKMIRLNKASKNGFVLKTSSKSVDILEVNASLSYVSYKLKSTESGEYIAIESESLNGTYDAGKPNIPSYSKLLELPLEASVRFKILSYDEEIIDLTAKGITQKIIPAQPSRSKSKDVDNEKFYYDEKTYNDDKYLNNQVADYEEVGILRSARLGRIIINPIQYNPVQNKLRILNNLKIEVEFVGSNHKETQELKAKYSNILFDNLIDSYVQNPGLESNSYSTKSISSQSGASNYVIISPRMFEETLQPFITHKQNMGYNVIVGYTDQIGNSKESIKNYLSTLYASPTPPLYVLLVGDLLQMPSYRPIPPPAGHVTDLYYFDYTNDNMPDVLYGRFSASNTTQLTAMINKTIYYENMPNSEYLNNAVLVSGNDDSYELIWFNGPIRYAANYCASKGITAHTYLREVDEPSNLNYTYSIIRNINNGVGMFFYSGHGYDDGSGFYDPYLKTSSIELIDNPNKYGLWIANSCYTNNFEQIECFGEAILRATNKGAIGYIGATEQSYCDEDYYWSVGVRTTLSGNPQYSSTNLGVLDRIFHTHGENPSKWCSTQGQINIAGNLAVQESNSTRKLYYWEIYNLLGDPSLNIRFTPSACVDNLTITTNISSGAHEYKASNRIRATNKIINNANVHYGANNSITLSPGFSVSSGSTFNADLDGCTGQ